MFKFESLEIWIAAKNYTGRVYFVTKSFPREETFSLTDQLRRASNSIPANIAEGSGSFTKKDYCHYLDIATKSLYETVSHLYIAKDQNYLTEEMRKELYIEAEILVKKIQNFKLWVGKNY